MFEPVNFVPSLVLILIIVPVFLTVHYLKKKQYPFGSIAFYVLATANTYSLSLFYSLPLSAINHTHMIVYDPVIYKIDTMTGLLPASFVPELFHFDFQWHPFGTFLMVVYSLLSLAVIFAASSEICHRRWTVLDNLYTRFALGAVFGFTLYTLLPAVGPQAFFQAAFPYTLPDPSTMMSHAVLFADNGAAPRNAMPSLHATWSILCFLALRNSPFWHRVLGFIYVFITFASTIGSGAHYALDWVVALPLVILIRGLTASGQAASIRVKACVAGAGLLAIWCVTIRMPSKTLTYPAALQGLILASISLPLLLELLLSRKQPLYHKAAAPLPVLRP